ncbi:hypothetical protein AMTRI_Chr12g273690 [Amborella trichopoda]
MVDYFYFCLFVVRGLFFWRFDWALSWVYSDVWDLTLLGCVCVLFLQRSLNVVMESKGGLKKKSSSNSRFYEAPLGYSIEDVRPHGGIEKFRTAAYSNCVRKPS